jgi:hypothetical protein
VGVAVTLIERPASRAPYLKHETRNGSIEEIDPARTLRAGGMPNQCDC